MVSIIQQKELGKLEKIKDFLHDFSDILFALIIAGIMFAVLTINLGSWFNEPFHSVSANEPNRTPVNQDNSFESSEPDNNIINSEDGNSQSETEHDINETETEKPQNSTSPDTGENEQNTETSKETKRIVIPNGTFCTGIAKILKDNGLINSEADFIRAAEDMRLSGRLKSGSFEIPVNTTVEDIARIIAGQKKI